MVNPTVLLKGRTQNRKVGGSAHLSHKCNAIPIKNPTGLLWGVNRLFIKRIWNRKFMNRAKKFLNKNNDGELALTDNRSVEQNKVHSIMGTIFMK